LLANPDPIRLKISTIQAKIDETVTTTRLPPVPITITMAKIALEGCSSTGKVTGQLAISRKYLWPACHEIFTSNVQSKQSLCNSTYSFLFEHKNPQTLPETVLSSPEGDGDSLGEGTELVAVSQNDIPFWFLLVTDHDSKPQVVYGIVSCQLRWIEDKLALWERGEGDGLTFRHRLGKWAHIDELPLFRHHQKRNSYIHLKLRGQDIVSR
jgi:hypothetical protein